MDLRFWKRQLELPGPIWVFGYIGVMAVIGWVLQRISSVVDSQFFWLDRTMVEPWLCNFANIVLWCVMLWGFAVRKRWAVTLAGWYAVAQALIYVIYLLLQFDNVRNFSYFDQYGGLVSGSLNILVTGALWFTYLLYLERSENLNRLFPREERQRLHWAVIGLVFASQLWWPLHIVIDVINR